MHSGLLQFPNQKYYDGCISTGNSDESRTLVPTCKLTNGIHRLLPNIFPSIFWDIRGSENMGNSRSFQNQKEADAVVQLIKKLKIEYNITNE